LTIEEGNSPNNLLHNLPDTEIAKALMHGGKRLVIKMAEQLSIESKNIFGR
jgi:hypothetical protein